MSHIVTIHTRVQDPVAIAAACQRLNLPGPVVGTAKLYSAEATGFVVQLPGWQYPAVIDTASGTIHFDNFDGHWGDQAHLNRFVQIYTVEKAKLEARRRGHQVTEQQLADGTMRVQIVEGY